MTHGAGNMGSRTEVGEVLMATPVPSTDMAMEQALQNMQDTQRRALLLRAQAGVMRRQQRGLQNPMQWLQNQLRRLQDTERWVSGAQEPAFTTLSRHISLRDLCPDRFLSSTIQSSTPYDLKPIRPESFVISTTCISSA